ncbi:MAG: SGNH/GDSL hydrolase family protein [Bacillus sp. (in: firmicutes)]
MKNILSIILSSLLVVSIFNSYYFINKFQKQNELIYQIKENALNENKYSAENTWLGKKDPTVVLMGSSVTRGLGASSPDKTWSGLLKSFFQKTNPDLNFINLGVDGFKTTDLLNISLQIISNLNPDVILIETCLINDFSMYTVSESTQNIETIVSKLKLAFPNVRIYLMPPNIIVHKNVRNSEGLLFNEYVSKVGDYIKLKGWNYIDFWNDYEKGYSSIGLTLEQTLIQDQIHPNDLGYELWFNAIRRNFIVYD